MGFRFAVKPPMDMWHPSETNFLTAWFRSITLSVVVFTIFVTWLFNNFSICSMVHTHGTRGDRYSRYRFPGMTRPFRTRIRFFYDSESNFSGKRFHFYCRLFYQISSVIGKPFCKQGNYPLWNPLPQLTEGSSFEYLLLIEGFSRFQIAVYR